MNRSVMVNKKVANKKKSTRCKLGLGFFDRIIDKIPVELHLPSYQYCGPGTKLEERLARGDKGVNKLDAACREHDIAYATHKDSSERYIADKKLGAEALKRAFSTDANFGERAASLLVSGMMKAKTGLSKIGMGISNCRKKPKKAKNPKKPKTASKTITFASLTTDTKKNMMKSNPTTVDSAIKAAIRSANKKTQGKRVKIPRILKIPKYSGGILPILPILAGLSAVGAIAGSTAGVVKTAKDIRIAQKQLEENIRHNKAMELKVGKGLYLRPHAGGNGLYLQPTPKNY